MKINNMPAEALRIHLKNPAQKSGISPQNALLAKNNDNTAVLYTGSGKQYAKAKDDPIQKSIQRIQDNVASIKSNDNLDQKTKDSLIQTLQAQLDELQAQLAKKSTDASNGRESDDSNSLFTKNNDTTNTGKNASSSENSMTNLISMGIQMDVAKTASSIQTKASARADLQQAELDHAVNHPVEALRLKDSNLIAKKNAEISSLRDAGINAIALSNEIQKVSNTEESTNESLLPETPSSEKKSDSESRTTPAAGQSSDAPLHDKEKITSLGNANFHANQAANAETTP